MFRGERDLLLRFIRRSGVHLPPSPPELDTVADGHDPRTVPAAKPGSLSDERITGMLWRAGARLPDNERGLICAA